MTKFKNLSKSWYKLGVFLFFLCIPFLLPSSASANPGDNLDVYFMYVGQGDGALLESNGKYMLIDCGPRSHESETLAFLKEIGVEELEYAIVTHGHHDHAGGITGILPEIPVKKLFLPNQAPPESAKYSFNFYKEFRNMLAEQNIEPVRPQPGEVIYFGTTKITFLAPRRDNYDSYNNSSIVVKIENGDNSFLFTGDAEIESEKEMLSSYGSKLKSDVLKVGHHSSWTSTSPKFLEAVDPSFSVISCGIDNTAGFPRKRTLKYLKATNVYRTDLLGTIHFHSDGTTITVDKKASQKASVDATTGELKNIYNTKVTSNIPEISLMKSSEKAEDYLYLTEPVTLNFSAEFGVTRRTTIKYKLVAEGKSYKTGKWVNRSQVTIPDNFKGAVYVRYANTTGDVLIRKTNEFVVDTKAVNSVTIISEPQVSFYSVDETIPDTTITAQKQLNIGIYADFGASGLSSIEYQLVESGQEFNPLSKWQYSNECNINGPFDGYVYARFTDKAGNSAIYRSQHIIVEGAEIIEDMNNEGITQ